MEGHEGLEPPTSTSEALRSIQLKLMAHKHFLTNNSLLCIKIILTGFFTDNRPTVFISMKELKIFETCSIQ